jgi:hypothetical protein
VKIAFVCLCANIVLAIPSLALQAPANIEAQLVRQTQELFDAVPGGDKTPFQKYFAEDCLFHDEKGRSMDKASLVKDIEPLPKGYSGTIKVVNVQSRIVGTTAVLSYDLDETETVFGQNLTARYYETDTWLNRGGKWQIVASQVFRYYGDPAVGNADEKRYAEYVGTYELAPGVTMEVSADGKDLYAQRGTRPKELLLPETTDIFFRKGIEGRRLFRFAENGHVDALIDRRNNEDLIWKKIQKQAQRCTSTCDLHHGAPEGKLL